MATNSHDERASSADETGIRERPNKRQKTEGRQIRKPRVVRQNRKATRAETYQRSKQVDASITSALIEWGSYNPDFPTSSLGEKELYSFLQRLEGASTFAKIRADSTARLISTLRERPKLQFLTELQMELLNLPQDDVILLTDANSLQKALNRPFQVPLLHRVTTNHPSLAPNTSFGIRELVEHLAQDRKATISVYDCSVSDPNERTRQTTVEELRSCFSSENACHTALNFLDIENRTKIQFCPSSIILQDITTRLDALMQTDKGKTGSKWEAKQLTEFFLVSKKNAVSTVHVDKGGSITWVLILEGRKIWYFPRHVSSQTIRWLALAGSQTLENYEAGWVKVELRPGDLL
jgi:hypothetical protein